MSVEVGRLVVGDRLEAVNGDDPVIVIKTGYATDCRQAWVLAVRPGYIPFVIDNAPDHDELGRMMTSHADYWRQP